MPSLVALASWVSLAVHLGLLVPDEDPKQLSSAHSAVSVSCSAAKGAWSPLFFSATTQDENISCSLWEAGLCLAEGVVKHLEGAEK